MLLFVTNRAGQTRVAGPLVFLPSCSKSGAKRLDHRAVKASPPLDTFR